MREISPAKNLSAEEYVARFLAPQFRPLVRNIRAQKEAGQRPRPSTGLVDRSALLTPERRRQIVDAVAELVDENVTGRGDMCLQFAMLLQRGLAHLGLPARLVLGNAISVGDREVFRWRHAWVRVGPEVVDGNVDAVVESPAVPREAVAVVAAPYWGPVTETPPGRRLQEHHGEQPPADEDVEVTWWPDLRARLDAMMAEARAVDH